MPQTRRRLRKAPKGGKAKGHEVLTIPELRRAFEHIENFVVANMLSPRKELVEGLQKEWKLTFHKELSRADAEAYVDHVKTMHKVTEAMTRKRKHRLQAGGGAAPLAGAPLDYMTRPGLYITPGVNQGSYALVPAYVDKGFWNPEPGHSYDPVPGQTRFPTLTPAGMGSNLVGDIGKQSQGGGARRRRKTLRGGATFLDAGLTAAKQLMMRPIPSSQPPSALQDLQTAAYAQPLGPSPEASQPAYRYQMAPYMPHGQGNFAVTPIQTNLMRDISRN
jgi:hypothetical protein